MRLTKANGLVLLLGALAFAPLGCALRFGEFHYFKSVSASAEPVNYFRVKVSGGSFLSSSRYVSGCFDERALDMYFGEGITQPADGKISPAPGAELVSLSCEEGGELLMILSSNSDAIAEQIGQIADNEEISNLLARLIRRDAILASGDAQLDVAVETARGKMLADVGDELIAGVDPATASPAALDAAVLQYGNNLAAALGATQSFDSLAALEQWVERSRKSVGGRAR
ncbi:MAG TPA: hypothetical protein VII78_00080 [Myxococcota bacterium]|jgi:hypothetical protein